MEGLFKFHKCTPITTRVLRHQGIESASITTNKTQRRPVRHEPHCEKLNCIDRNQNIGERTSTEEEDDMEAVSDWLNWLVDWLSEYIFDFWPPTTTSDLAGRSHGTVKLSSVDDRTRLVFVPTKQNKTILNTAGATCQLMQKVKLSTYGEAGYYYFNHRHHRWSWKRLFLQC